MHLPIDIQRDVSNTIIWGYLDRRDRNPSHIRRWIPEVAEQHPPLSPNEVIHRILLPAAFARGYREQQRRYSAPVRTHPPTVPAQPLARTRSLSLHSNSTDQSFQTAPTPGNTLTSRNSQDAYLDTQSETQPRFTTTPRTVRKSLKQRLRKYGLSVKARIAGFIGDFIQRRSRPSERRTL